MGQGPGDGHPLLLATGQVSRAVTESLAEPYLVKQLLGARSGRAP
jgi:hypothetical protein